jgi:hypothetical protein
MRLGHAVDCIRKISFELNVHLNGEVSHEKDN